MMATKLDTNEKAVVKRKNEIIEELFRLDPETYLELPLYSYRMADLERVYIKEKCKPVHAYRYKRGNGDLL